MASNGETLKYRVGRLEEDKKDAKQERKEIKTDINKIMTNHLPHMQEEIVGLKTRVNLFGTLIMGALSTIIALLIGRVL